MSSFTAADHLGAVAFTAVASLALAVAPRLRPGRWILVVSWLLGVGLIVNEVWYFAQLVLTGNFTARYSLPLYLCDAAAIVAGIALIYPRRSLVEVTYFWALAGTLQGLLTPDAYQAFPSYLYFQYYIDHCGVVIAAFLLVVGRQQYPGRYAVPRVFAITVAFTALAGLADALTGGDYMYLRSVPESGSLLSYMGPWPWYIASGVIVAGLLLMVLDAPFWRGRRRALPRGHGGAALTAVD